MHHMLNKTAIIILVCALLIISGCRCHPDPQALPPTRTAVSQAAATTAAATEEPTETEPPSPTVEPSATPEPTEESEPPTPTPEPTPQASPTPEIDLTPIGEISAAQAGEEVTIQGTVVGTASFSAGFKFTLDDGSGQITLLMWHNVYDDCWDAAELNIGATVQATGEIGEYEGELQIEPDFGGDVRAIEGAAPWATARDIGSLSGDDAGTRVMIEGTVSRLEGYGSWAKVFVADDSGEVVVFIYANVLDRIQNNTAIGTPGTRVRVVGTVDLYQSNLELIPALPVDVIVLEAATEGE